MGNIYEEALVALHGIWRQRWLALAVGWGVALLGWLAISLIPNTFKSEARIFIQPQSLLPDKVGITANDRQQGVETVRQTLTSVTNLEKIVRATDLSRQLSNDKDVTNRAVALQKRINIVAQQDNLFQISVTASEGGMSDAQNAKLAKAIVQKLIDLFVDGNLRDGRVETGETLRFLDAQLQQRAQQLAEAEAKRAAFEGKYLSGLPGSGSVSDRIGAARTELVSIESDLAAAQSSLSAINGQMAATPATTNTPGIMIPGAASANAGRIAVLEAQIADAQSRGWTDAHPDMVSLRAQLARARAQGDGGGAPRMTAGSSAPNPMYISLRSMQAEKQATANALAARKAQLQAQINQVVTQQAANPEVATQQTQLDRDYQVLKAQYDKILADREDIKLRGQVQTQTDAIKFSVIDPPSTPRSPAAPNRPLLLTLVLAVALAAGVGAAFARGQLQTTYATVSKLEKASGMQVIGAISEVVPEAEKVVRRKRLVMFAGGAAALAGVYVLLLLVDMVQRSLVA